MLARLKISPRISPGSSSNKSRPTIHTNLPKIPLILCIMPTPSKVIVVDGVERREGFIDRVIDRRGTDCQQQVLSGIIEC